jgi:hypothetical protein
MPALRSWLAAAILALGLPAMTVADQMRGLCLYENHCMACHESVVHIREARKAKSLTALRGAIRRWSNMINLDWSAQEVDDVLEHLNARYYRFDGAAPDLLEGDSKLCLLGE